MFGSSRPMNGNSGQANNLNSSGRRHQRVSAVGRAFARLGDGREGSVLDMSIGGILLRLKRVLNLGSSYFVKLLLDGKVAVVEARVVRLVTRNDDCLAGMEFIRLSQSDRKILQKFVGRR